MSNFLRIILGNQLRVLHTSSVTGSISTSLLVASCSRACSGADGGKESRFNCVLCSRLRRRSAHSPGPGKRHANAMAKRPKALWNGAPADIDEPQRFLDELLVNTRVCKRSFSEVARMACAASHEASLACLFRASPAFIRQNPIPVLVASLVVLLFATITVVCNIWTAPIRKRKKRHSGSFFCCSCCTNGLSRFACPRFARQRLLGCVERLAPTCTHKCILQLLSSFMVLAFHSASNAACESHGHTLSSLIISCQLISMYCQDYGYLNADVYKPSRVVSQESGMLATMLMASRLCWKLGIATQLLSGAAIYSASPHIRHFIRTQSETADIVTCACSFVGALLAVHHARASMAPFFIAMQSFIILICPAWLVRLQRLKCQLSGPWDEATVPSEVLEELRRLQRAQEKKA